MLAVIQDSVATERSKCQELRVGTIAASLQKVKTVARYTPFLWNQNCEYFGEFESDYLSGGRSPGSF